jgi:hypothetical protein
LVAVALLVTLSAWGCGSRGQPSGRPDIDAIPKEELYGAATKAQLYEFRAKVRKRGAAAAKQDLPDLLDGLKGYERQPVGQYKETYKQIVEKLEALQGTLGGSPSKDAVVKVAEEIGVLADKLPGKADANPQVE